MPNRYKPAPMVNSGDIDALHRYVAQELQRISTALGEVQGLTMTSIDVPLERDPQPNDVELAYFDFGPPGQRGLHVWNGVKWVRIQTAGP